MAVGSSFKQMCPSCEAQVLIKDVKLIGKKVECPKCKYRFVVEDPVAKDKAAVAGKKDGAGKTREAVAAGAPSTKGATADKVKAGKPTAKGKPLADDDDSTEGRTNGVAAKTKPSGKRLRDDEGRDDKPKKKTKPTAGNNKLMIGLGLAAVGLIVLGTAAWLLTRPKGTTGPIVHGGGGNGDDDKAKGKDKDKDKSKGSGANPQLAHPELTNLLPKSTQHVFRMDIKTMIDGESPLGVAAFTKSGAFKEEELRGRVGFALDVVDDLIRAENYTEQWSFTVVHTMEAIDDLKPLVQAMGLKPESAVNELKYYKVTKHTAWLRALAKLPMMLPSEVQEALPSDKVQPLYLHQRDRQTLIFANLLPLKEYLDAKGRFEYWGGKSPTPKKKDENPKDIKPKDGDLGATIGIDKVDIGTGQGALKDRKEPREPADGKDGKQPDEGPTSTDSNDTFMTIEPSLKAMLERMWKVPQDTKDRALYCSATLMKDARIRLRLPNAKERVLWRPRQMWDVTNLLEESNDKIVVLGTAFHQKDKHNYLYQNALECGGATQAKELHKELKDRVAPTMAKSMNLLMGLKVDVPKDQPVVNPTDPKLGGDERPIVIQPDPIRPGDDPKKDPKDVAKSSRFRITQTDKDVLYALDLVLDDTSRESLIAALELITYGLRAEVDLADGYAPRYELASAGKKLGEMGVTGIKVPVPVPPGHYPPGAFRRESNKRFAHEPNHRVAWMAGLLPHLGHDTLFSRIQFNDSWKDPSNWLAARTLVPEFLDPSYPANRRYVRYPGMPLDVAGTHYVGLAGVGQDIADLDPDDPVNANRQFGVFGYDRMTAVQKIKDGRGLSHTILLIRVPHDTPAGVTPWMAGGGSTVRHVPDKNSLEPFLTTENDGSRGTYVLMTDGSVRYIKKGMSDEVFKALASVKGPAPADFDLDELAPIVPREKKEEIQPPPKKDDGKKEPPKKEDPPVTKEDPPVKKDDPPQKKDPPSKEDRPKEEPSGKVPDGWKSFASKENGFQVLFPGDPKSRTDKSPTGAQVNTFAAVGPSAKLICLVGVETIPAGVDIEDKQIRRTIFDNAAKGVTIGFPKSKITKEDEVMLREHAGREYEVQAPGFYGLLRVYLMNGRVYLQMAGSPTQAETMTGANIFFPSLQFTQPEAPDPKQPTKTPTAWKEFTSKEDRFSIMFPTEPKVTRNKTPFGQQNTYHAAQEDPQTIYVVSATDVPPKEQKFALDQAIKGYLGSIPGAKVTRQQPVPFQKYQGREIQFAGPKQSTGVTRFFLIDRQVFILAAVANGPTLPQDAQTFFNSFRVQGESPKKKF